MKKVNDQISMKLDELQTATTISTFFAGFFFTGIMLMIELKNQSQTNLSILGLELPLIDIFAVPVMVTTVLFALSSLSFYMSADNYAEGIEYFSAGKKYETQGKRIFFFGFISLFVSLFFLLLLLNFLVALLSLVILLFYLVKVK